MADNENVFISFESEAFDKNGAVLGWHLINRTSFFAQQLLKFSTYLCSLSIVAWFVLAFLWAHDLLTTNQLLMIGYYFSIFTALPFVVLGGICLLKPVSKSKVSDTVYIPKIKLRFSLTLLNLLIAITLSFVLQGNYFYFTAYSLLLIIVEVILLILKFNYPNRESRVN